MIGFMSTHPGFETVTEDHDAIIRIMNNVALAKHDIAQGCHSDASVKLDAALSFCYYFFNMGHPSITQDPSSPPKLLRHEDICRTAHQP